MSLGKTLTELRKKAGLTQGELGAKLNISAQAISKWENDISEPDITTLKKLSSLYSVPLAKLLDPNASVSDEAEESDCSSVFADKYDLYITNAPEGAGMEISRYYEHIFDVGELLHYFPDKADELVKILPLPIAGIVEKDKAERVMELFAQIGVSVVAEPSSGNVRRRHIKSLSAPPKDNKMKRRFLIANITAAIAAVISLVFSLLIFTPVSETFNLILIIAMPLCFFCQIFLAWYPTVTRFFLVKFFSGFSDAGLIASVVWLLLALLVVPLIAVFAPFNYAVSIVKRIRRMKNEDRRDDVFSNKFDGLELYD